MTVKQIVSKYISSKCTFSRGLSSKNGCLNVANIVKDKRQNLKGLILPDKKICISLFLKNTFSNHKQLIKTISCL